VFVVQLTPTAVAAAAAANQWKFLLTADGCFWWMLLPLFFPTHLSGIINVHLQHLNAPPRVAAVHCGLQESSSTCSAGGYTCGKVTTADVDISSICTAAFVHGYCLQGMMGTLYYCMHAAVAHAVCLVCNAAAIAPAC
jgi:hypothetical protein